MKRNVTVQLDEDVIAKIKVLAAQRGTSISGLVTAEINRLAAHAEYSSDEPDSARVGRGWTREELYAERTDRWS